MAHPQMFDDADPFLARVRELALALPDAAEKVSHGRPAFFTTKVFAYYGWSVKADGEWVQRPHCVVVLLDPGEREALLADERSFVPPYLGGAGWLGVDLDLTDEASVNDVDWDEVAELLDASYRMTAGPRRVAALEQRG
ncbi:MmcQ/YjbR family DNA-binding protein [Nocardioides coralli]|uniref:MmcQ/YjbR family DNA-binding protein n=1 Tax=Nocardioides coralli TaxID=2872154 RepID=UPI001CA4339C|nr:MmcQ/YjbR family DNA-binding protein [Nocardioides coralli]QZY28915.1 MmcQ/YjbR family DNA-binding protein [Nocardioides coralli]